MSNETFMIPSTGAALRACSGMAVDGTRVRIATAPLAHTLDGTGVSAAKQYGVRGNDVPGAPAWSPPVR